jgi:hypothetical protein
MRYVVRLKNEPFLGRRLQQHRSLGDLSDCRKIYLDEAHDIDPRWRIIYRLLPDEQNPEVAEVIIVGPRDRDAVYLAAMTRLQRPIPGMD